MNDVLIRVAPDKYGGVGLFALTKIPKDTRLDICQETDFKFVNKKFVKSKYQKEMFQVFGVATKNGYWVPKSFNSMSIGWLINHSDSPTLEWRKVGKSKEVTYFSKRAIKSGEELTIDYNSLDKTNNVKSRGKFW